MFALFLSLAATLAFGLAPAFLATSSDLQARIKEGGERSGQRGGRLCGVSWRSWKCPWPWCYWLRVVS